jgi:hypothetical protein
MSPVKLPIACSADNSRIKFRLFFRHGDDRIDCEGIGILRIGRTVDPNLWSVYITIDHDLEPNHPGGVTGKLRFDEVNLNQQQADLLRPACLGLDYQYECIQSLN